MDTEPTSPPFRIETLLAHREWVERTARALVFGDAGAGDDVAQQMWSDVLERPPERAPASPRGWLRTVLGFKAIDAGRAARARRVHEDGAARRERHDEDPAEVVAQAETLDRVAHAVLELEEPYRTTVLLRYFKDLPPRAIASMQRVPVETVRTRIKRAMAQLRVRLDAENEGERRRWCLALLPLIRRPMPETTAAGSGSTSLALRGALMGGKAKAAVAAGALLLLLGGWFLFPDESRTPLSAMRDAGPGGLESAGTERSGPAALVDDPSSPLPVLALESAAIGGRVRGEMVLPTGGQVNVTVTRNGLPVRTRAVDHGEFTISYDRDATDPASFVLEASGPGWKPQFLPLPAPDSDLGEIRMFQGIRYGGRVEDVQGRPVGGVRVAFLWSYNVMGVSSPTKADGWFSIPLDVETSLPAIPSGADGTRGIAAVLPLLRGRDMAAVPVESAGFRGEQIVRIAPEPGVRIRLLDGESRGPLAGWEVCLKTVLGAGGSTEPVHPVFDSGVTDASGIYEPLWIDGDTRVELEARRGSRRFVAPLDRKEAKAAGTVDIVVPPETRTRAVLIRVLREDGDSPAAGVGVLVGWRVGRDGPSGSFRATTDGRGEALAEVAAPEPASIDPPVVTWGWVAYLAEDGRPVMEDVPVGDPRSGVPVSRENPLVVRLGGTPHAEVTWFRIREAESGGDLVPVRLFSSYGPNTRTAYLVRGLRLRDRSGHSLWPAFQIPWQGWRGEPLESLRIGVIAEGRAPRWFDVPVSEFVRARATSTPILLEFPRHDGDPLEIAVQPAEGSPRAGILVTLSSVPPGRPAGFWEKVAQCTTDEGGIARFLISRVEPGASYRVTAFDPVTGEAGGIPDPRPGRMPLRMESPRSLAFSVTLPDGSAPGHLSLSIEDPCFVLPPLVAKVAPDGRVEIPRIVASLYELRIQGRGPSRPYAELEPGVVRGGADPTPPGDAPVPESARTTTWYGLKTPADRAGSILVLR